MKLEFEDIINPTLNSEIDEIESKIDKAFKKEENKKEKYAKNPFKILAINLVITLCLLCISPFTNIMSAEIIISLQAFVFTILVIIGIKFEENIYAEQKKVNVLKNNVFTFFRNKKRNINAKRINKQIDKLTPRQKEMLKLIEKNDIYKKSFDKTRNVLLTEKLLDSSQSEFDLKKEKIFEYINNIENEKEKIKLNNLIEENFEIEKPKKVVKIVRKIRVMNKINAALIKSKTEKSHELL
jgi:hypothetical protein